MKIKVTSTKSFRWDSNIMDNKELLKTYSSIPNINQFSTNNGNLEEKDIVFFCMEKRDDLSIFINLNNRIISDFSSRNLIYFPYAHLSSIPLSYKESCYLFREISSYLSINVPNSIITPFYYHKKYTLETIEKPLVHFYDSEDSLKENNVKNDYKKNTITGNLYLDDVTAPFESLRGTYFKGPIATQIEKTIEQKYKSKLLSLFNYINEVESPLLYSYQGRLAEAYLNKFPARQFHLRNSNTEYFLRIATCHAVFSRLAEIKDLKVPIGYYEKALCFRKEQPGEIKKGERYSAFVMPDCHLIVPKTEVSAYFKKILTFLKNFYQEELPLVYKTILRTTGTFDSDQNWDSLVKIEKDNYFCEKVEFEVAGIQLATLQIDLQNVSAYFKREDLAILHFSPGSLERICNLISRDNKSLSKVVDTYIIYIGEFKAIPTTKNIVIRTKAELKNTISSISDNIYNLVVIGEIEKKEGIAKKKLRIKNQKGSFYEEDFIVTF